MGPTPIPLYDPERHLGIRTIPTAGEVAIEMLTEMYIYGKIDVDEFENRVGFALVFGPSDEFA
jgi:hypothetical protein